MLAVGRTTGFTTGTVQAINVITPGSFSVGGDSGALVVVDGMGRTKNDDR
jgi:hypothetical protein